METTQEFHHRSWIVQQIRKRQEKNPAFSLRAFARTVGMSPSHLSNIISDKRPMTPAIAEKLARRLNLTVSEQSRLLQSVAQEASKSPQESFKFSELNADNFMLVSQWYYFAILGLAAVRPNQASGKWIAKRLKINEKTATKALKELLSLRYIKHDENNGFLLNTTPLMTKRDVPSQSVKEFHRQILDLASRSLDNDTVENRHFEFRGVALDPAVLPQLKQKAIAFQNKITNIAHQQGNAAAKRVYAFNTQLFPIDGGSES